MRIGPNRGLSAGQEKVRPEEKVKGEKDVESQTNNYRYSFEPSAITTRKLRRC